MNDTNMKVDVLYIPRDEWLRGTGAGSLLDERGKRCCLGHYCKALGASDDDALHVGMPHALSEEITITDWLLAHVCSPEQLTSPSIRP